MHPVLPKVEIVTVKPDQQHGVWRVDWTAGTPPESFHTRSIDAPDTVLAGAGFTVTISTFGSTGHSSGPSQVSLRISGEYQLPMTVSGRTARLALLYGRRILAPVELRFDMAGTGPDPIARSWIRA